MIKRLTIRVCGRVHGVFFRAKTKEKADSLGLVGWIRNNEDGAVDFLVEGEIVLFDFILFS